MGSKYPVLKPTEIINCLKNSDSNTKAKKEVMLNILMAVK